MKSIKEIRRENLQKCVDEAGSSRNFLERFGHLYGVEGRLSASYLSQLLSGTTSIGDGAAKKFEKALGKSANWFDMDRNANSESASNKSAGQWPFTTSKSRYESLPHEEKERLDGLIEHTVSAWEHKLQKKSHRA